MTIHLTPALREQFAQFLEYHHPQEFSIQLRNVLFQFLSENVKNGFPHWFDSFLWGADDLFRLLDIAAAELQELNAQAERKKQPVKKMLRKRKEKRRLPAA